MNNHYLYLIIDLCCIAIPFLFSFHPKINFHREWRWFLPANAIIALVYLVWDVWFTQLGIWGFSEKYITGIMISNLPLEEVLFFICIPYACVFTYFVFKKFELYRVLAQRQQLLQVIIMVILLIYLIAGWGRMYTTTAVLSAYVVMRILWSQPQSVTKAFIVMYVAIVPAFIASNGILTGYGLSEPVVWYNDAQNLGLRFITIPVEDFVYGFALLGANVLLYEFFKKKLA